MPSIIVLDTLSPDGLALLDAAKPHGITYEVKTGLSGDALREALAQHDGAICRSGVKITAGRTPAWRAITCSISGVCRCRPTL